MSQLILSRGTPYRSGIKNLLTKFFPNVEFGSFFLMFSLVSFVALVTVITLVFSTRQVTKGYVLNSLEDAHQVLIKDGEQMDMRLSDSRSLRHIQDLPRVAKMRNPNTVVFLSGETSIASR